MGNNMGSLQNQGISANQNFLQNSGTTLLSQTGYGGSKRNRASKPLNIDSPPNDNSNNINNSPLNNNNYGNSFPSNDNMPLSDQISQGNFANQNNQNFPNTGMNTAAFSDQNPNSQSDTNLNYNGGQSETQNSLGLASSSNTIDQSQLSSSDQVERHHHKHHHKHHHFEGDNLEPSTVDVSENSLEHSKKRLRRSSKANLNTPESESESVSNPSLSNEQPSSEFSETESESSQTFTKDIELTSSDKTICYAKKKIVLDLKHANLGHRLLSLESTSLLANLMDRTLEIDWDINPKISPYAYTDLFAPMKSDGTSLRPKLPFFAFDYGPRPFSKVGHGKVHYCEVSLDQWNFDSFYLLKDKILFERLNTQCDVINLKSNQYYNSLLFEESVFGESAVELKYQFPSPFYDISKIIFIPRYTINTGATAFIKKKFEGIKWLSFYAKGFFEGSRDTVDAFACINKLLDTNEIQAVFFTAETSRHIDLAYKAIKQTNKIITIERDMQSILTKDPRRKDLDVAMLQWLMIGQADYCMANSVRSTIFAMTAFVAGPCKYVPVIPLKENEDVSMCSINNSVIQKDNLFTENPRLKNLSPEIDDVKRDKVWASVLKENKKVKDFECIQKINNEPLPSVTNFWNENGKMKINQTKVDIELALKLEKERIEAALRAVAPTASPTIANTSAPTVAVVVQVDRHSIANWVPENWNPTAAPTIKPTPAPTVPLTFKKLSALDRLGALKSLFSFSSKTTTPDPSSSSSTISKPTSKANSSFTDDEDHEENNSTDTDLKETSTDNTTVSNE